MNVKGILVLSLGLNAVLAAGYFLKSKPARSEAAPPPTTVATNPIPSAQVILEGRGATVITNAVVKTVDWRAVESEDYKKYIANLRAIGCPEETIRDIITADVNKLFDARRKALASAGEGFKFWKCGTTTSFMPNEERLKQLQALVKEKRDLLRDLLGIDVADPQEALAVYTSQVSEMLGFLPPAKQAQLIELEQRYAARQATLSGQTNETAKAAIKALQLEKEAEVNALLSPEEREFLELTASRTAQVMRNQLGEFNPTEQEFRDIFKARKKLDEQFELYSDTKDPAVRDQREAALFAAYDEIHKSLGDERWADYRSAREWTQNSGLRQVAEAEGIPKAEAMKVPDIRDTARAAAIQVRNNPQLNDTQRQAALAAIALEAQAAVNGILGEKATAAYLKQSAASWLRDLAPAAKP